MTRFPERIGDDVRRELGRFGTAGTMAEIVEAWPAAVGDSIALNAWPARVNRDGTLHVATNSSAWAFELGLLEGEIRGRLTDALGTAAPKALRFAPGRLPEPSNDAASKAAQPPPEPTLEDRRQAARIASSIEDENLRKIVAKAAASSLAKAAGRPPALLD